MHREYRHGNAQGDRHQPARVREPRGFQRAAVLDGSVRVEEFCGEGFGDVRFSLLRALRLLLAGQAQPRGLARQDL